MRRASLWMLPPSSEVDLRRPPLSVINLGRKKAICFSLRPSHGAVRSVSIFE